MVVGYCKGQSAQPVRRHCPACDFSVYPCQPEAKCGRLCGVWHETWKRENVDTWTRKVRSKGNERGWREQVGLCKTYFFLWRRWYGGDVLR